MLSDSGSISAARFMDGVEIVGVPPAPVTVVLDKQLPQPGRLPNIAAMAEFLKELQKPSRSGPLDELQRQNPDLILTLNALEEKQSELLQVNRELEETNRGVVALYSELDEKAESLAPCAACCSVPCSPPAGRSPRCLRNRPGWLSCTRTKASWGRYCTTS